jgi:hypothetical protein
MRRTLIRGRRDVKHEARLVRGTRALGIFEDIAYQKLIRTNTLDDTTQSTLENAQLLGYMCTLRVQCFSLQFSLCGKDISKRQNYGRGREEKPNRYGGWQRVRGTVQCLHREPRMLRVGLRHGVEVQLRQIQPPWFPHARVPTLQSRLNKDKG